MAPRTPEKPPGLVRAVNAGGRQARSLRLGAEGGRLLQVTYHTFTFVQPDGRRWARRTRRIAAPRDWRWVYVGVAEWDLRFGGHAYEDHAVAHCGVDAGVAVAGGRVTVVGAALLRDRHGDDPWRGAVTVQVMFVG